MNDQSVASPQPGFVAGSWSLFVVFEVFLTGLLAILIGVQLLRFFVHPVDEWHKVAAQIPGFLLWCVLAVRAVRLEDARGAQVLGFGGDPLRGLLGGLGWFVPLGLVWMGFEFVYSLVLGSLDVELPRQSVATAFTEAELTVWARALLVFAIVGVAPLAEEVMFRGLLHGWLRRFFRFWSAALIGGAFFGLLHVEDTLRSFLFLVPLALFGVMAAWVRERPCGLWGCIAFHSAHNATQLLLLTMIG